MLENKQLCYIKGSKVLNSERVRSQVEQKEKNLRHASYLV